MRKATIYLSLFGINSWNIGWFGCMIGIRTGITLCWWNRRKSDFTIVRRQFRWIISRGFLVLIGNILLFHVHITFSSFNFLSVGLFIEFGGSFSSNFVGRRQFLSRWTAVRLRAKQTKRGTWNGLKIDDFYVWLIVGNVWLRKILSTRKKNESINRWKWFVCTRWSTLFVGDARLPLSTESVRGGNNLKAIAWTSWPSKMKNQWNLCSKNNRSYHVK